MQNKTNYQVIDIGDSRIESEQGQRAEYQLKNYGGGHELRMHTADRLTR